MKKRILLPILTLLSVAASADNVAGYVITKTDGSTVNFVISNTRSIKFADGSMVINNVDNTQQSISIDDISSITFDNVPSAIKAIAGTESTEIKITDLGGRMIYSGDSQSSSIPSSLHGVYIITANGHSHKIVIK